MLFEDMSPSREISSQWELEGGIQQKNASKKRDLSVDRFANSGLQAVQCDGRAALRPSVNLLAG